MCCIYIVYDRLQESYIPSLSNFDWVSDHTYGIMPYPSLKTYAQPSMSNLHVEYLISLFSPLQHNSTDWLLFAKSMG